MMNIKQKGFTRQKPMHLGGFTIVELLVVLAIFGILSGLVVITLKNMKDEARLKKAMECAHTVRVSLGSDLVGEWTFDDASNLGKDSSGSGNDGTVNGVTPTDGIIRGAGDFEGGTDCVVADNVAVDTLIGAKNTVEFWMRWDGTSGRMPFGWHTTYDLWFRNNAFGFNTGNSNIEGILGTSFLVNSWHHIVAIFYNGVPKDPDVELHIDGVKQIITHQCGGGPSSRTVTPKIFISGWGPNGGYKFFGRIDEVRIYNRALTTAEIQKHYAEGAAKYGICLLEKK